MKKIVILGAGRVGGTIARDLCKNYEVTAVDANKNMLKFLGTKFPIKTLRLDLSDKNTIKRVAEKADLVINALPGFMGYAALEAIIKAGKNLVDISFFKEDPLNLDALAKSNDVTAAVDCGIAPGMANIILGYHSKTMAIWSYECMVGGLPFVRQWPFEYKAPFSPTDVIEEYVRPARYVEGGNIVIKPALSDAELVYFKEVGTLEAFNTDGLRTLLKTYRIPDMKEKTMRYPGHIKMIQALREAGFFERNFVEVKGLKIRPIDFTSAILFSNWQLGEKEEDFTIMRLTIRGEEKGEIKTINYHLFDRYDKTNEISSMARTTGYTCAAAARLVIENKFNRKGICPPEYIGENAECFGAIINYLKQHNVIFKIKVGSK